MNSLISIGEKNLAIRYIKGIPTIINNNKNALLILARKKLNHHLSVYYQNTSVCSKLIDFHKAVLTSLIKYHYYHINIAEWFYFFEWATVE